MHVGDIDVMIDVYIYVYCLLQWNVKKNCNSRGLCRVPWARHSAKIFETKYKISLPSASPRHSAKYFFKKNSEILCRVPKQEHSAKKLFKKKNKKTFAECRAWALGKVFF